MRIVQYEELTTLPIGTFFCEDDLPAMPLYIIRGPSSLKRPVPDVVVESFHDGDRFRMGFPEMEECDRNSMRFLVYDHTDISNLMLRLWNTFIDHYLQKEYI